MRADFAIPSNVPMWFKGRLVASAMYSSQEIPNFRVSSVNIGVSESLGAIGEYILIKNLLITGRVVGPLGISSMSV